MKDDCCSNVGTPFPHVSTSMHASIANQTGAPEPSQAGVFDSSIIEAITAHICVLDDAGKIVMVNEAWRAFARNNPPTPGNAFLGDNYLAVCDRASGPGSEEAADVAARLRAVLRGDLPSCVLEYPCHSPGEQRWFILRAARFTRDQAPCIVVAHEDITLRRRAEETLRESERMFRAVVEDLTEVICRFRADGTFIFVNEVYCRFFGKTKEELVGRRWQPMAVSEEIPMIEAKLREMSPSKPVVVIENRVYSSTGEVRWMQFVNRGFFDASGWLVETQAVGRDITDRKQAEAALGQSQARFRLLFEAIADAVLVFGVRQDGFPLQFADVNPSACQLLGYAREELLALSPLDLLPLDEAARLPALAAQLVWDGHLVAEVVHVRKDGTRLPVELSLSKFELDGRPMGLALLRDATERRRVQEIQAKLLEQLREKAVLLDTTHEAILVRALDARIRFWNRGAQELYGWTGDEVEGQLSHELLNTRFPKSMAEIESEFLQTGRWSGELVHTTRAGRTLVVDSRWTLMRDGHGQPCGIMEVNSDITQRKQAEEELAGEAIRRRILFDQSMDGIVVLNDEGGVYEANRSFANALGVTLDELGRMRVWDWDPDWSRERVLEQLWRTDRRSNSFETRHRRKDGTLFPVEVSSNQVEWAGRRLVYCVCRDITVRKRAEEALHKLSGRLLVVQDEERRRIARELHDSTAQELAALLISLHLLDEVSEPLSPRVRRLVNDSLAVAEQCSIGVRTLSYLLHPPVLDDLGLAGAVRDFVDGFARRSKLRVDLDMPQNLGRLPREMELTLFRVLQESLVNVTRHSGSKTASIRLCQEAGQIRLEVEDSGRGMASIAAGTVSLGVGIAGMRERVWQLGGRLEISSGPGGTTVRAVLPWK